MRSGRSRRPSADPAALPAARTEERRRRALAQRYMGAALIGLAIVAYWLLRLIGVRWLG